MNASPTVPSGFKAYLLAARPKTLSAGAAPMIFCAGLALRNSYFDLLPWLICLVYAVLMQIACNFANDYFDFKHGTDTTERVGPKRMVASGTLSPQAMLRATLLVLTLAFAVGLTLLAYAPLWIIGAGIVITLGALAYSGGPVPLSYIGLGDVLVLVFYGIVPIMLTDYILSGSFHLHAFELGLVAGLLADNILIVNNYRDYEEDKAGNKKTLTVIFGRRFSLMHYAVNLSLAFALIAHIALVEDSIWLFLPLICAPLGIRLSSILARTTHRPDHNETLAKTAKLLLATAAFFCIVSTL